MPQNLLDTHTLIWYLNGAPELSQAARNAIEADQALNFVSIALLWEMAIKISLDKLELKTPFRPHPALPLAEINFRTLKKSAPCRQNEMGFNTLKKSSSCTKRTVYTTKEHANKRNH